MSTLLNFALASVGLAPALPADLFVDASASCAAATGSAAAPFCSITDALAIAANGDVLRIAAGTYVEQLDIDLDVELVGVDGAAQTIVSAGGVGRVVTVQPTATVVIDGLTLTGGGSGAVSNAGELDILRCVISGNTTSEFNGTSGVEQAVGSGPLLIEDTTVSGNVAQALGGGSGLSSFYGGHVTILRSTFDGNTSAEFGVLEFFNADATIESTTISNNTLVAFAGNGSVFSCYEGAISLINSTIDSNQGSAFFASETDLDIRSSTITRNEGDGDNVGGLNFSGGTVVLTNSIIAANTGGSGSPDILGAVDSTGFNIIGDGGGIQGLLATDLRGTASSPLDPRLSPLQGNGGPTSTRTPLAGSPAIDAGDPANTELLDQRGAPRTPGAGDIGSVERGSDVIGAPIAGCVAAPNSSGQTGILVVSGSVSTAANDLQLVAASLPMQQFGFFVASRTPGFSPGTFGASNGNLCLSGTIGRFNRPSEIRFTGPTGAFAIDVDLTAVPNGAATIGVQPGETWHFQAWHRELGGLGSNFTSGRAVTFQ